MGKDDWMRPKPTDGPVSRYINRKISTAITKALLASGSPPSPDTITIITTLTAFLAAYLVITVGGIVAGLAVQLASIVDGVDGEIARATGRSSRAGAFLDSIMDRLADISIIVAMGARLLSAGCRADIVLYLLAFCLSGDLLVSYLHARGEMLAGMHPSLLGSVRQIASRDVRLLVLATGIAIEAWLPVGLAGAMVVVAAVAYAYVSVKAYEVYTYLKRAEKSLRRA